MTRLFLVLSVVLFLVSCQENTYQRNQGDAFGTYYNFIYASDYDFEEELIQLLDSFSNSLSTYDSLSLISQINQNKSCKTDSFFRAVFRKSEEIFILTDGAFDITVAPLVNGWGFGFSKGKEMNQLVVDSLLNSVGMDKISLENNMVYKVHSEVMLDVNAIAKGYGVDVVAQFMKSVGISDFLVEIGGEVVTYGLNPKGVKWRLGIDRPIDDPTVQERSLEMVLELSGQALATSGNYRNFYIKEGKKYAHTIHPKTGWPVEHNLLSASIIAPDCMTADAFATACMVVGLDESLKLIESLPNIEGCFIFHTDSGNQVAMTSGFEQFVVN